MKILAPQDREHTRWTMQKGDICSSDGFKHSRDQKETQESAEDMEHVDDMKEEM